LFKENVIIRSFHTRNKELSELKKLLHLFDADENKIPKEKIKDELDKMKNALEELIDIDKQWLRFY